LLSSKRQIKKYNKIVIVIVVVIIRARIKTYMINKQQYEAQLRQIFKLLLQNKTQDEIARELDIGVRTVSRYTKRIERRYGEIQRRKTDNTLFLECNLLKNRLLTLYKALENQVVSDNKTSGTEKAKCAEFAANIAIDVLKMESEGIKVVKDALIS
jgi:DNA-binding transcriptional regulator LsrR (DeoR family)